MSTNSETAKAAPNAKPFTTISDLSIGDLNDVLSTADGVKAVIFHTIDLERSIEKLEAENKRLSAENTKAIDALYALLKAELHRMDVADAEGDSAAVDEMRDRLFRAGIIVFRSNGDLVWFLRVGDKQ